jgi:CspA family cold shock protein
MYNGQRQLRNDLRGKWIGNRNPHSVVDAHDEDVPPEVISSDAIRKSYLVASVKWFDGDRGYGFLDGGRDGDIFVHRTILRESGIDSIAAGDVLTCDVGPGQKGRSQVIWVHSVGYLR